MSKKERKRAIPALILGALAVYLVIATAIQGASRPDLIPIFNIVLVAGLVAVTAFYAYFTLKMAEEMREQRYNAVRPAIDFKRDTAKADINRRTLEAHAASSGEIVHGLSCILCNVGVGSAIDVRSFIEHPERGRLPFEFGTIESRGKTERWILSISHESNRIALVASYEDIYGRTLESSREVSIDKENHDWKLGRLKVIPVKKGGKK